MIPDFLVIGAQKSGTTWLDRNLRNHPNIWLPPEKEIHFFDFPPLIPFFFLLFAPERPIRHWGKNRMLRDFRKVRNGEQRLSWYCRYYFFVRSRRWYLSLFTPETHQIAGEITPRYAILSERHIAKIHALMPDGKIIYLLRNPIDRLWSDLAMFHSQRFGCGGLQTTPPEEIDQFIRNAKHIASSRYTSNLHRWEKFYPPEQIFIGFQDQIRDNPVQLIQDIYQFLGLDHSEQHLSDLVNQRINSHDYPEIPKPTARSLAKFFLADIEILHQRFNNTYTADWLATTRQYLTDN